MGQPFPLPRILVPVKHIAGMGVLLTVELWPHRVNLRMTASDGRSALGVADDGGNGISRCVGSWLELAYSGGNGSGFRPWSQRNGNFTDSPV